MNGGAAVRLDVYLAENGMCKSRTAAQSLIRNGGVSVNGTPCEKPSCEISEQDDVKITGEQLRYVGRGGLKLEGALNSFGIALQGLVCLDIGSSTGGFTDCMLQNGAARVYAVDVGTDQLDGKLRADSRVVVMERTDIRTAQLPEVVDFVGTDVSFISLKQVIPHIFRMLKGGGTAVALIKPQFEAGRSALNKKGIVKDEKTRRRTVDDIKEFAQQCGFEVLGLTESPIHGGDGNIEYLIHLGKD
ncbi:MAG: TlyA family RNA methyltransferase [Oscillospiraceae bacterium]|nr:TlyA family RNA methyltransferase [Oscillospiraceae bacterium]